MKKRMLASLSLVCANLAIAAPMTSDVQLGDAMMAPGQTGAISLSKLVNDVPYDVSCTIASNGKAQQDYDAVKGNFNAFSLDGVFGFGMMLRVEAKGSAVAKGMDLKIPGVYSGMTALQFTNIDDTDTVSLYNCVAKVHF